MGRNYVAVPHEYLEEMEELTNEEFGRLIRGLLSYSLTGEVISPVGNERFYVKRVMRQEDVFQASFESKEDMRKEKARKAAQARWCKDACAENADAKNAQACSSIPSNAQNATLVYNSLDYNNNITNLDISLDKNGNKEKSTKRKYTKRKKEEKESVKEKEENPGDDFERFWKVYPRKVGIGNARASFEKAIKKASVDQMIEAVEKQRQSRQWKDDGGKYIPLPATWLNQERWGDKLDVEVEQPSSNGFLEILREMEEEEKANGVVVSEQDGNSTGTFGFESGLPKLLQGDG